MKSFSFLRYKNSVCVFAVMMLVAAAFGRDINVAPAAGDGVDYTTIQAAINAADEGDVIIVSPGRYVENINLLGKAITLQSTEPIDPSIVESTIIDGGGMGSVIRCDSNETAETGISGFVITGGSGSTRLGTSLTYGGGMYNYFSSPTISNCIFIDNAVIANGGGVYNGGLFFEDDCKPTFINCTFSENRADGFGGVMNNYFSSPVINGCTFTNNTAGRNGGGMINYGCFSPEVTNCVFSNNVAEKRGDSSNGLGGGLYDDSVKQTVRYCLFIGNSAQKGGGIYNMSLRGDVNHCIFVGNNAEAGGGLYTNGYTESYSSSIANCIFIANRAKTGGGMNNILSRQDIFNCTFRGNVAETVGGGIYNEYGSIPTVSNCIIWGNSAGLNGEQIYNRPQQENIKTSEPNFSYCDIEGCYDDGIWDEALGVDLGGNIDADPLFVDAGYWDDNGTADEAGDDLWVEGDYRLMSGSPCIDAGDNLLVAEGTVTDLDGLPRFVDDLCTADTGFGEGAIVDMGAYEFVRSDIARDGMIDLLDLSRLAMHWGDADCDNCDQADLTCDGNVDVADLAVLAEYWMGGSLNE